MSNAVINPGEQSARTYGHYQVVLSLPVDGGYAINVHTANGGHRYNELSFTTRDVDTANLAHRIIKTGGEQGVSPEGVRQALTDALTADLHEVQRRHDTPSRNRVEHINRLLDDLEPAATRAAVAQLADDVTAYLTGHTCRTVDLSEVLMSGCAYGCKIMHCSGCGRDLVYHSTTYGCRVDVAHAEALTMNASPAAATLADIVPAGRRPQVARSRSNVERLPLTPVQRHIVAGHTNGVVYAGRGIAWTSLQSIVRKGHADVLTRAGQKITAIRLRDTAVA